MSRVDALCCLLTILHKLSVSVVILMHHLLVVVALHEVRNSSARSWVEHLLTVLTLLAHHLMMLLLLLLELVVEGLELGALVGRARREDCVDVLPEGDLRAESVHLVVV